MAERGERADLGLVGTCNCRLYLDRGDQTSRHCHGDTHRHLHTQDQCLCNQSYIHSCDRLHCPYSQREWNSDSPQRIH